MGYNPRTSYDDYAQCSQCQGGTIPCPYCGGSGAAYWDCETCDRTGKVTEAEFSRIRETRRLAKEERRRQEEQRRVAAEEAKKAEATARAAREEAARKQAAMEAERKQQAAREEAARQEAARKEAAKQREDAAKQQAAEEAARRKERREFVVVIALLLAQIWMFGYWIRLVLSWFPGFEAMDNSGPVTAGLVFRRFLVYAIMGIPVVAVIIVELWLAIVIRERLDRRAR